MQSPTPRSRNRLICRNVLMFCTFDDGYRRHVVGFLLFDAILFLEIYIFMPVAGID
jgi:hypothetical protein